LLINRYIAVAVTVARGIDTIFVTNAPLLPAVAIIVVFVGASAEPITQATVDTAVKVFGVCANGAVKVFAMIQSFLLKI
jgi:hypothetical protein